MKEIHFAIGCSNSRKGECAIEEAYNSAIQDLGTKPQTVLVFSTIQYSKTLPQMLNRLGELTENKPTVGGSVTGFICNKGCYTRGVVIVLAAGDLTAHTAMSKNVRANPKKAAETVLNQLNITPNDHALLLAFTTGASEPEILANPYVSQIISALPNQLFKPLRKLMWYASMNLMGLGPGKEEEFLSELDASIKNQYLIGFSTFDDWKAANNFQFFGKTVLTNSNVVMALIVKPEIPIEITHRELFSFSGKKFKAETAVDNYFIDKINGKPAVDEYLSLMGWPTTYRPKHVSQNLTSTFYYPLGIEEQNLARALPAGMFVGKTIASNRRANSDELSVFLSSNKLFLKVVKEELAKINEKTVVFSMFSVAAHVVGTLGAKLFKLKKIIDKEHGNIPYLMIFGAGEHSKQPGENAKFDNFTMVRMTINN